MKKFTLLATVLTAAALGLGLAVAPSVAGQGTAVIKVSEKAPDFSLPASDGTTYKLSEHIGKHNIVLFFYPKDDSPVCSTEACSFRDSHQIFKDAGADVVGISSDSIDSHKAFVDKLHLPYVLLSDDKNATRKLYGVGKTAGLIPGRVTFLIDKKGVVRNVFDSQLSAQKHVDETLKILKTLD